MVGTGFQIQQASKQRFFSNLLHTQLQFNDLVATALIQSSSTVTSIIVGLVAGGLPVERSNPAIAVRTLVLR